MDVEPVAQAPPASGGLDRLIDVGRVLRRWSSAGRDVKDRSSALVEAVPVAIVAGSVVWAT